MFPLQLHFPASFPRSKHLLGSRKLRFQRSASEEQLHFLRNTLSRGSEPPPHGPLIPPQPLRTHPAQAFCDRLPQLSRLITEGPNLLAAGTRSFRLRSSNCPGCSSCPRQSSGLSLFLPGVPHPTTAAPAPARLPDQSTSLPCASSWESESPASRVEVAP